MIGGGSGRSAGAFTAAGALATTGAFVTAGAFATTGAFATLGASGARAVSGGARRGFAVGAQALDRGARQIVGKERALREEQHNETADITDRNDNQEPFQRRS